MKNGLKEIVGKQIASVVVASSGRGPKRQVFLVFTDGTRFELYGENFSCCSGLDRAEGIERYVESGAGKIERVYGDVRALAPADKAKVLALKDDTPPPATLEKVLRRDLDAWREANEAIAKARAKGGFPV
jgi:hypothetical protein